MTVSVPYRVLARKYRPQSFKDLRGQEVLVRTLSNAIESGRIAHAFVLTGIRGIGKTTTARIIARALNCTGPTDTGGPTIDPCGLCGNCMAIASDRHVDVIEMDAATNTGVDNVRDLIEAVQYGPALGRYKIFIIDEVHMLSKSAFNALLKTLEEPPPYIKFIFATTELRKIPVTILSRCQRFDLKRLDTETLAAHLTDICAQESVEAEAEALTLIANAGDGSVRDALSLLDQAIAHSAQGSTLRIQADAVRGMLGLADRSRVFELITHLAHGDAAATLADYRALYAAGADIPTLLEDVAEIVHFVTQVKIDPALGEDVTFAQQDRDAAKLLAEQLGIPALSRLWQMALKGLQEVQTAPNPHAAVQMVLIRIAYAGTLPTPSDLLTQMQSGAPIPAANMQVAAPRPSTPLSPSAAPRPVHSQAAQAVATQHSPMPDEAPWAEEAVQRAPATMEEALEEFARLVAMFSKPEPLLYHHLMRETRLVSLLPSTMEGPGKLELDFSPNVPKDAAGRIGKDLSDWTGQRWIVILSHGATAPTLQSLAETAKTQALDQARIHPLVAEALSAFPGAELTDVVARDDSMTR